MKAPTIISVATFFMLVSACRSAPPVDLTDPGAPAAGARRLNEDDLVYTDNTAPLPDVDKEFGSAKMAVAGRSSPGREGKIILRIKKNEKVRVLKMSHDQRWLAVIAMSNRKRAWVPVSTIRMPKHDADAATVPAPAPRLGPPTLPLGANPSAPTSGGASGGGPPPAPY